ncbi:MAG: phage portal protein [Clostridia bacterium]
MKITDYLEQNYNVDKNIVSNWSKYTNLWNSWYQGKVSSFHDYKIYNGRKHIHKTKLSLQMAKKVCEDWADILFNDRVKIELDNEGRTGQLFDVLQGLDFWHFMNASVERSGSIGTGAVIVSVGNIDVTDDEIVSFESATTNLDYIDVNNIYPISWNNGSITECAFVSKRLIKGQFYVLLTVHRFNEVGNMVIDNVVFAATNNDDLEIADDMLEELNIFESYDTGSPLRWFAILKPAGTNNINPELPFGLPYFSQAIDVLQRIDETFDSMQNEIQLGRKRIFVRDSMLYTDETTGESREIFDTNDVSIYLLPKGFNGKDLLQSESSSLRVQELTADLQSSLSMLGDKCGFGVQYYQLDPAGQVREIGILTQNSKLIRRKKKHEIVLESALFDIVSAVLYTQNINADGLKITFDDKIIDDEDKRREKALMEVSQGIMSKAEYRVAFYGEDIEVAKEKVADVYQDNEINFDFTANLGD